MEILALTTYGIAVRYIHGRKVEIAGRLRLLAPLSYMMRNKEKYLPYLRSLILIQ